MYVRRWFAVVFLLSGLAIISSDVHHSIMKHYGEFSMVTAWSSVFYLMAWSVFWFSIPVALYAVIRSSK